MPIYEYECEACEEIFSVLQARTDPPPERHSCGSTRVRRILSKSYLVFKGSGFYVNDYGKGLKNPSGTATDPAAKAASSPAPSHNPTPAVGTSPSGPASRSEKGGRGDGSGGASQAGTSTSSKASSKPSHPAGRSGGASPA